MDKKLIAILATIGVVVVIIFYLTMDNRKCMVKLEKNVERIDSVITAGVAPVNFDYVLSRFRLYNYETDTSTVNTFLRVVDYFGLNENDEVLEWLVGQLCLESGARQFYMSDHRKHGQVVRGSSGEVGITQIMPATAIGYLRNHVSDPEELYALGATDFSFVDTPKKRRTNVIKWLSNPTNNIILWGLMTRDNLQEHGILKGLVAYNAGVGGMKRFVKRKQPHEHSYIRHIKDTLVDISEMLGEA